MKPLLSIVIANYNYGRFLEEAIRSVVEQDRFDQCELIIVDGGSTDNSVEVIRKYADKIAWWCSEKDKGQSDAFNKGFAHARGRFGSWLNADDVLIPGAINVVVQYIRMTPSAEWISGGVVWMDEQMLVTRCSANVSIPFLLQRVCPGTIVGGPSSFFRLDRFRQLGAFDVRMHYAMDNDLWLRMLNSRIRLHIVGRYLWAFRVHEGSKTSMNLVPHDISGLPSSRLYDRDLLRSRYPNNVKYQGFLFKLISVIKICRGVYLKSRIDTWRYRGLKPLEIQ